MTAEVSQDARLVDEARGGDRVAFARLYDRYARMVHGVLLARVPRHEVEDLVQDVFLLAWRRVHTLREPGAFGGWLAMIARNRARDFYRRSRDVEALPEDSADAGPRRAPHAAGHDSVTAVEAVEILQAIGTLPETYRETLILRLVEGMTGPEIAERTGLAPGSVRVNLYRGMELLRKKLGMRIDP